MKDKKVVNTNLGILLICLFSAVFTMADFIIIDHVLDKYVDYSKCQCDKCDVPDDGVNKDNTSVVDMTHYVISDDFSYEDRYKDNNVLDSDMNIRTVKDQIVLTGEYYGSLSVDNGKFNMYINRYFFDPENRITYIDTSFETIYLSHSFEGENVKYIYHDYFMPSGDHVIWVLTDAGNVYLNNFNFHHSDFNTDFFDKFEKKYSNVTDLKLVDNVHINESGSESIIKDIAVVINGETIILNKWGN